MSKSIDSMARAVGYLALTQLRAIANSARDAPMFDGVLMDIRPPHDAIAAAMNSAH